MKKGISMVFLIILALIIVLIAYHVHKENKFKEQFSIPKKAIKINHFSGDSYPALGRKLYLANTESAFDFWGTKTGDKLEITKENILSFSVTGEKIIHTKTTGGGASIGGAVVGGVIAGPVGAIIGGRKKAKTQEYTTDDRKVILKFKENDIEKGLLIDMAGIWDDLCFMCPEKKLA